MGNLTQKVTSYAHETIAIGGYWTAQIVINLTLVQAEDWFENGLGRRIEVTNPAGVVVWEGFVNKVSVSAGALSEERGELVNVGNRDSAIYTPLDASVYPPVSGTTTVTTIAEDTTSQTAYGIWEKVVSAGTTPHDNAEQVRDVFLAENSLPMTSGALTINPGSAQPPVITLDCLGYIYWLGAYIYNNATSGYDLLSDKLIDVLAADPNGVISTNYNSIEDNAFLTPTMENENRFAWDVIKELVALGNDTDDLRRLFGVYAERIVRYETQPETITYYHRLTEQGQYVTTPDGEIIYPWDVQPGKWLFVPDFLVGLPPDVIDLYNDPRAAFLESVRYSAPFNLDLSSGTSARLSQLLAKISYSGGLL